MITCILYNPHFIMFLPQLSLSVLALPPSHTRDLRGNAVYHLGKSTIHFLKGIFLTTTTVTYFLPYFTKLKFNILQ